MLETPKAFWYIVIGIQSQCKNPGDGTMDNQQERSLKDKAWFAGIMEGEGWFCLTKDSHQKPRSDEQWTRFIPACGLCNADSLIIKECERILIENSIEYKTYSVKPRKSVKGMTKPSWQIMISGQKRCIILLNWIKDELRGEKKNKAEMILEYCNMRKEAITGFYGVPYSERENQLCQLVRSSTTTRQTCKA